MRPIVNTLVALRLRRAPAADLVPAMNTALDVVALMTIAKK